MEYIIKIPIIVINKIDFECYQLSSLNVKLRKGYPPEEDPINRLSNGFTLYFPDRVVG